MRPGLQARIRIVQSPANRWVKALRAALRHPPAPAHPGQEQLIALEGVHLLTEALRSGLTPNVVFVRIGGEAALEAFSTLPAQTELLALPPALFGSVVETQAPQGIAALVPAPSFASIAGEAAPHAEHRAEAQSALILVFAALQDPGNVGTLLRSAEAFGATGAILLAGTASPWSGKALRASAGSALRLPLLRARDAAQAAALLRERGIRSYAAVPTGGTPAAAALLHQPTALWVGNEGAGLSRSELEACDERISLPMPGGVESLNAAVAGSLLLYEAARSRADSKTASEPA